ncbi:hypothetical protein BaRGS_00032841 [Batillaria attramentaria]|uniref:Uncharacterized protein n=1 Tax=Batillaria attramentaria TaxID=370345 RepID=A0ABD0JN85_9CAEN
MPPGINEPRAPKSLWRLIGLVAVRHPCGINAPQSAEVSWGINDLRAPRYRLVPLSKNTKGWCWKLTRVCQSLVRSPREQTWVLMTMLVPSPAVNHALTGFVLARVTTPE